MAQLFGDWPFFVATAFFLLSDLLVLFHHDIFFKGQSRRIDEKNVWKWKFRLDIFGLIFILVWLVRSVWPCVLLGNDIIKPQETLDDIATRENAVTAFKCGVAWIQFQNLNDLSLVYLLLNFIADTGISILITKILFADLIRMATFLIDSEKNSCECGAFKEAYDREALREAEKSESRRSERRLRRVSG